MNKISDDQIAALRAAEPTSKLTLVTVEVDGEDFEAVVRNPTWAQWRQYRLTQTDPEQKPTANKQLCAVCLVAPTAQAFDALLNEYPGLADTMAAEIGEIAGISRKTTRKKL